ncbi:DUF4097 family beta strand repeat-containing protein [[Kitasatospora] papulosa]|uniref:DUF4097 family beta strand repeat-containing protein n=1 Tax=[Kitasatospora] papulosa TaxID=1464011 RepID=UPI0036B8BA4C
MVPRIGADCDATHPVVVEITVPPGSGITANSETSSMSFSGSLDRVSARSMSGSIEAESLSLTSGEFSSMSGDVDVLLAPGRGELTASSMTGDVRVSASDPVACQYEIRARSMSGRVSAPEGASTSTQRNSGTSFVRGTGNVFTSYSTSSVSNMSFADVASILSGVSATPAAAARSARQDSGAERSSGGSQRYTPYGNGSTNAQNARRRR